MSIAIKLPSHFVKEVKTYANLHSRSVPKQIEYWSRIGKIAEENQDLPYSLIKDIFLGLVEVQENKIEEYSLPTEFQISKK